MNDDPWREGRKAWDRLTGWDGDDATSRDGPAALHALSDIGRLRHLLNQAELGAVRTARGRGRSWAEIATRLGITRQSAWERWSDLDQEDSGEAGEPEPQLPDRRAARALRRRSTITVPRVIGMTWNDARTTLERKNLVAIGGDPDAPPPELLEQARRVVTSQAPESGAKVPAGAAIRLWTERGGGAGVREPRRPRPEPRVGRALPEHSDEALG